MNFHNFNYGTPANRQQTPLTLDQVKAYAPSAFALAPHESRSARYTYVPTVAIIEGMIKAGFQPFKASQSRTRTLGKEEFTKHMIRFRSQSANQNLAVGDTIPEIVLINSHDGTSTYQLSAGLYRLVCSNGLMVSEALQDMVRVKHSGDIIGEVIEGSNRIASGSGLALERVKEWSGLMLTAGEQQAFADAAHTLRFADSEGKVSTPITAAQLLRPRRSEDNGSVAMITHRDSERVYR